MTSEELAKWKALGGKAPLVLGVHGPIVADMNPRKIEFKAKPGIGCNSCIFSGQRAAICNMAGEQAALRGLPACDDNFIYFKVEKDQRQNDLIVE